MDVLSPPRSGDSTSKSSNGRAPLALNLHGQMPREETSDLQSLHPPRVRAVLEPGSPCCSAPDGHTARDGELQLNKSICGIR